MSACSEIFCCPPDDFAYVISGMCPRGYVLNGEGECVPPFTAVKAILDDEGKAILDDEGKAILE